MNKIITTICFCLSFLFLTSCGVPDYTQKIHDAYYAAVDDDGSPDSDNDPTNPTDPTDDPTNPTNPFDPTDPTDDPTDPTEKPTEPTDEPTDPPYDPTSGCYLDDSFLSSDAEHYFAYRGIGTINPENFGVPQYATARTTLVGIDGKDLDYGEDYSFYYTTFSQASDGNEHTAIAVKAQGDPEMSNGFFTTVALAIVPVDYINAIKEYAEELNGVLPAAPLTTIYDLLVTSDNAYSRQCVIAVNKYGPVAEFGNQEVQLGKTKVCYDDNTDFSAGETFKMAMVAELTVGDELIHMFADVETSDDLCTCIDLAKDAVVDCKTIPEFKLPECSTSSGTPCKDSTSGLTWSSKASDEMNWENAKTYCENLTEGGYNDWRLPTINDLRTLIQNCSATEPGGSCAVSDPDHLAENDWTQETCDGCGGANGVYSKFGDDENLCSSSPLGSGERVWCVNFYRGSIYNNLKDNISNVRCVRSDDDSDEITFPYADSASGLTWSSKSSTEMNWEAAKTHCENLTEAGYNWRLPTIDELRTLIKNCPETEFGGNCAVSDPDHLASSDKGEVCNGCGLDYESGIYSKFGNNGYFWSSSTQSNDSNIVWFVSFDDGSVDGNNKSADCGVRCVQQ